jgi:uncharacterized membrane protein
VVALLIIAACARVTPRVDPRTGSIRVLFIGDALMAAGMPAPLFVQDPLIGITPLPAEIATILGDPTEIQARVKRFFRLYLPRTEERLLENFDVVIIAATQADYPSINFQSWLRDGVRDHGLGFLMADDPASFGGAEHGLSLNPSWADTPVGEILSVECATDRKDWGTTWFRAKVTRPDCPMVRGVGWEGIMLRAHNRVFERDGSEVVMVTTANPPGSPVLAWIEFGLGRSVSFVNDWGGKGNTPFYLWPSAPTALANMVYFASQVQIPEDLEVVRMIRDRLGHYTSLKSLAISTIEFADKFGASTRSLEAAMGEAEGTRSGVLHTFASGDFQGSLEMLDMAVGEMYFVQEVADRAMRRALFWIYLSEWLVVTGTGMLSAFVLWTVMVRRRLYREVGTTRQGRPV